MIQSDKKDIVKSRQREVVEWIVVVIVAVVLTFGLRKFVVDIFAVNGTSMLPTLRGNERIVVNKIPYYFNTPQFGDVIVFHTPEKRDFIKRVIGLPGDKIKIGQGEVYRNGKLLAENYIKRPMVGDMAEVTIPSGELFVMGDNRNNSKDSREIGTVSLDTLVGRADFVLFPASNWGNLK